ncbi:MAG TPA: FkbM family methyltransferase [Acidimicrobiales bacterium]|nr:FkbM family methyltransferase [Acidimicrobiales bacterium]
MTATATPLALVKRSAKAVLTSRGVRWTVSQPPVCRLVTPAFRPLSAYLPRSTLFAMPVQRRFEVTLDDPSRSFAFEVHPGDSISKALFWYGLEGYERHALKLMAALVRSATTLLDVGANSGVYTLLAAASNDDLTVHAFEPVPAVFARLQRNVGLNRFPSVHLHQMAVSDTSGRAVIHVPRVAVPLESSLLAGFRPDTDAVDVEVTSIDDFVTTTGLESVDVMKIDTEGTAHTVITGALGTLERHAPLLLCEVLYSVSTDTDAWPLLRDLGYQAFLVTTDGLVPDTLVRGDPEFRNMNYVFAHADRVDYLTSLVPLR